MIDVDKNSIIDLQIINDTLMVNIESPTSAARIAMQRIIERHFKGELKYVMLSEEKDGPYINTDTTGNIFHTRYMSISCMEMQFAKGL